MTKCTSCVHCGAKTNENCSFDGNVEETNKFTGISKNKKVFEGVKTKEELNGEGECPHFKANSIF